MQIQSANSPLHPVSTVKVKNTQIKPKPVLFSGGPRIPQDKLNLANRIRGKVSELLDARNRGGTIIRPGTPNGTPSRNASSTALDQFLSRGGAKNPQELVKGKSSDQLKGDLSELSGLKVKEKTPPPPVNQDAALAAGRHRRESMNSQQERSIARRGLQIGTRPDGQPIYMMPGTEGGVSEEMALQYSQMIQGGASQRDIEHHRRFMIEEARRNTPQ